MWPLFMERWGRATWDDLIMYVWEQLMYQWEGVSWFKLREPKKKKKKKKGKNREISKITLIQWKKKKKKTM